MLMSQHLMGPAQDTIAGAVATAFVFEITFGCCGDRSALIPAVLQRLICLALQRLPAQCTQQIAESGMLGELLQNSILCSS